jgi:hypothetical protein
VWDSTKVRDLIDSLYRGYPIGYFITWQNPSVKLKDGTSSKGKKILIDGQQRITAIMAALLGKEVLDDSYRKRRIVIAFNPLEETFEVSNAAIQKDPRWIPDISKIFSPDFILYKFVDNYCQTNLKEEFELDELKERVHKTLDLLKSILYVPIGIIELNSEIDINEVTEIFIRINSTGAKLSQADFAMSKIAVDEKYGGHILRKAIDYFCHLASKPEFYSQLINLDPEFIKTEYFKKMNWLKDDSEDMYDPSYTDMLRVSFVSKFHRGRLSDLVALLSGRDFETRQYKEEIAEESFQRLSEGIYNFINETNFKKFIMIVKSAGFIEKDLIRSKNALNFAYILYLTLKEKNFHPAIIETLVRKWLVLSIIKSRYSGSSESQMDTDIRRIVSSPTEYIENVIKAELSESYWNIAILQELDTSVSSSPVFSVYLAAQVKMNDKGFLSKDITVADLISLKGDVHHIYPREYLKSLGYNKGFINQIANYVITQTETNIKIGKKSPQQYFAQLIEQCQTKIPILGTISDLDLLKENLKMNCIPIEILDNDMKYEEFLIERRKLMAEKIRKYFQML